MKRNEGRKGKATPVSEIALKRRGRERKVLCFLCLEHCIKCTEYRNKRTVLSKRVQQKGTSWIPILHILLKIQVLQVKLSTHWQAGKHVIRDGFAQVQLLFWKGWIPAHSPGAASWGQAGMEESSNTFCCLLVSYADTTHAQKTDPSYLVLLFHFWTGTSLNHPS